MPNLDAFDVLSQRYPELLGNQQENDCDTFAGYKDLADACEELAKAKDQHCELTECLSQRALKKLNDCQKNLQTTTTAKEEQDRQDVSMMAQSDLTRLDQENQELRQEIRTIEDKIDKLQDNVREAQKEITDLKEEIGTLDKDLHHYSKNIKQQIFNSIFGIEIIEWKESKEDSSVCVNARFTKPEDSSQLKKNKTPTEFNPSFFVPIAPINKKSDSKLIEKVIENIDWVWEELGKLDYPATKIS